MENERKYQDHEIRQILELAMGRDEGSAKAFTTGDGLTLLELQGVGHEVGLPEERIAQAVAAFEGSGESAPRGTTLGLPTSVGSSVPLPRGPSEREWEMLVAELRTTFGGKGEVTMQGGLRAWSHGNLHAFIEPTENGHRLRMIDSSVSIGGIVLGGFFVALALLILVVLLGKTNPGFRLAVPGFLGLIGGGLATGTALSLPKWARRQELLMERLNRHAVSMLSLPAAGEE